MKYIVLMLLAISICLIECSSETSSYKKEKLDSVLKHKLDNENSETFFFYCVTKKDIDEEMIKNISSKTGIKINSSVNNKFFAQGNKMQLLKLSSISFIQKIVSRD